MKLSLKLRLALLVAGGTAIVSTAAAVGIWTTSRDAAQEQVDTMLRSPGRRLTERTGWNTDWSRFNRSLTLIFGERWNEDGICRVVGHGPRYPVYFESRNWPEDIMVQHPVESRIPEKVDGDEMMPLREPFLYDAETLGDTRWRMVNLANGDLTIHLGMKSNALAKSAATLAVKLGIGVGALTLVMFALTWLVARQALRPLAGIVQTTESITSRQLDQRIEVGGRTDAEFAQLVTVLNAMIERLERSFHQSTRFSADASHELKTPITNLFATVTTRLQQCGAGSEEQQFLAGLVHELDRIRAVLGGLLLLARADGGRLGLSRERVEAETFLRGLGEDFAAMVEAEGLRYEEAIDCAGCCLPADPIMLTQALHNLVRNAVDYNCANGFVRWEVSCAASWLEVKVSNSGAPIAESFRAEVFGRFKKGPRGGHGLGLNIVKEVIEAHGGRVSLEDSSENVTTFRVRLPVAD